MEKWDKKELAYIRNIATEVKDENAQRLIFILVNRIYELEKEIVYLHAAVSELSKRTHASIREF